MCTKDKIVLSLYQHTISWGDVPSDDDVLELDDWKSYQKIKTRAKEAYQHHVTAQKVYTIPQRSKAKKHCDKIASRIPSRIPYIALKQRSESTKEIIEEIVSQPPIEYQEMELVPNQMVSNEMVPNEMVSNEMVPNQMVSNEMVPNQMVSNEIVPNQMVSNEIVPNEIVPNQIVPNEIVPNQIVQNEMMPNQIVPNQMVPNQMAPTEIIEVYPKPIKNISSLYVLYCIIFLSLTILFYRITHK